MKVEEVARVHRAADPFATIRCRNDRYTFLLEKPKAESEYLLRDLSSPETGETLESLQALFAVYLGPYAAFSQRVADILKKPDTRLKDAVLVRRGERSLVRLSFDFRLTDRDPICPAWILFDPEHGWSVQEYEGMFGTNHDRPRRGRVEYEGSDGSPKRPRRVIFEHSTSSWSIDFDSMKLDQPLGLEDFTLPAYGLPDLPEGNPGRRLAYWLLGAALLALALAMALRRYANRLAPPRAAPL